MDQHTLDAIQASGSTPLYATRALAMESIAVFDVLNAIDNAPAYMVDLNAPHPISATAAAAAHRILTYTFPTQTSVFASNLAQSLEAVPDGKRESTGGLWRGRRGRPNCTEGRGSVGRHLDLCPAPPSDLRTNAQWGPSS